MRSQRAQVLIEECGSKEHKLHICHLAYIPRGEVLVEGFGISEH